MGMFIDLSGQTFGRLIVLERSGLDRRKHALFLCICQCGNETVVAGTHLRSGHTQSCGCFRKDVSSQNAPQRTTHGHMAGKPSLTYNTWRSMRARCTNSKATDYASYGGAGVTVCPAWMSFENFLHDMGERPVGTTLGRILDRGNYEPGNVFWMTRPEQELTKKNNHALLKWQNSLNDRLLPKAA